MQNTADTYMVNLSWYSSSAFSQHQAAQEGRSPVRKMSYLLLSGLLIAGKVASYVRMACMYCQIPTFLAANKLSPLSEWIT